MGISFGEPAADANAPLPGWPYSTGERGRETALEYASNPMYFISMLPLMFVTAGSAYFFFERLYVFAREMWGDWRSLRRTDDVPPPSCDIAETSFVDFKSTADASQR